MKKLLLIATLMFAISTVYAEAETKKACITQKDAKTGKELYKFKICSFLDKLMSWG